MILKDDDGDETAEISDAALEMLRFIAMLILVSGRNEKRRQWREFLKVNLGFCLGATSEWVA